MGSSSSKSLLNGLVPRKVSVAQAKGIMVSLRLSWPRWQREVWIGMMERVGDWYRRSPTGDGRCSWEVREREQSESDGWRAALALYSR